MAINPCQTLVKCDCEVSPFRNLSAELPDPPDFFALDFFDAQVPLGAPDTFWNTTKSVASCTSPDSQQAADDCALRRAEEQVWNTWPEDGRGGPAIPIFGNNQTQCVIPCPEGFNPFIYTVPAGTFIARTQEEADVLAASVCETRGRQNRVCTPIPMNPTIELVELDIIYDLSDNGVVAGSKAGLPYYYDGTLNAIPTLGGVSGEAVCCNSIGDLGGHSNNGVDPNDHAFWVFDAGIPRDLLVSRTVWDIANDGFGLVQRLSSQCFLYDPSAGSQTNLGTLGGNTTVGAINLGRPVNRTINGAHVCAVSSQLGNYRPCRWDGVLNNITPTVDYDPGGDAYSIAVNSSGNIVGRFRRLSNGFQSAFFNASGGGANSTDIGHFGGNVQAYSISDSHVICGQADDGTGTLVAFKWTGGAITILPKLSGTTTGLAYEANNNGDVVGIMGTKAFLHRNGVTIDLFTLIPADKQGPSQWTALASAFFINNNKQIAGFGTYNGVTKGYLMRVP